MPIDVETYLRVNTTLDRCHRSGWDPVEEMDRLNLILSPAARTEVRLQILDVLLERLSTHRPVELLRRKFTPGHQCSPADMYTVILEYVEEFRNAVKEAP